MRHMGQFVRSVTRRQEAPTTLALYRVLLCSSALYSLAIMGDHDVFEATWVSSNDGGLTRLSSQHWLFSALGGFDASAVRHLYQVSLCLLTFGLIGFGGRATLLFAQQSYVALRTINENSSGGYDSLICLGLLVLGCASSTATLSVDCRLLYGRFWRLTPVSAWPRALLVFQLLLMYTMTGIQKIGHSWTPMGGYTALHYVLNDPTWLRWDLGTLPEEFGTLLRLATAVTWHWEQLSLLLLLHWYFRTTGDTSPNWLRRLFRRWDFRYPWAAIGLILHVSILVLFDLGPFSLVSLAYYVNLWAPREWHAVYRWLAAYWRAQPAETKSQ